MFLLLTGCIRQVEPPLRSVPKILVVEGGITNDSLSYQLRLTYSGPFRFGNFVPDSLIEEEAIVTIKDDAGSETFMTYHGGGLYKTDDAGFVGVPGRAYSIAIKLPDGKTYVSNAETMPAPVSSNTLSRIDFDFLHYGLKNPSRFKVYADIQDPGSQENYYRWVSESVIPRKATGVRCGFGCIKGEFCQQPSSDTALRYQSDEAINGNTIKDQLVATLPTYWFGRYYLDIGQYSITRSYYQFLRQYEDQTTKTGTILDPMPAPIVGNVFNAADPSDRALGYFSVSSVYHHKVVLLPLSLSEFILQQSASRFIPVGECTIELPNTTELQVPAGFENAEEIRFNW